MRNTPFAFDNALININTLAAQTGVRAMYPPRLSQRYCCDAARDFHLMPERIGELVVTGDRETVFGERAADYEALEASYRPCTNPVCP